MASKDGSHCPSLPPELWLIVFENLDYLELKKSLRVSKQFQTLINSTHFDTVLFRPRPGRDAVPDLGDADKDREPVDISSSLRVHPIFEELTYQLCNPNIDDIYFSRQSLSVRRLVDHPVSEEYATTPMHDEIRLYVSDEGLFFVQSQQEGKGITVREMMEGVCEILSKFPWQATTGDLFNDIPHRYKAGKLHDGGEWINLETERSATVGEVLACSYGKFGPRRQWKGFIDKYMDSQGDVELSSLD